MFYEGGDKPGLQTINSNLTKIQKPWDNFLTRMNKWSYRPYELSFSMRWCQSLCKNKATEDPTTVMVNKNSQVQLKPLRYWTPLVYWSPVMGFCLGPNSTCFHLTLFFLKSWCSCFLTKTCTGNLVWRVNASLSSSLLKFQRQSH